MMAMISTRKGFLYYRDRCLWCRGQIDYINVFGGLMGTVCVRNVITVVPKRKEQNQDRSFLKIEFILS